VSSQVRGKHRALHGASQRTAEDLDAPAGHHATPRQIGTLSTAAPGAVTVPPLSGHASLKTRHEGAATFRRPGVDLLEGAYPPVPSNEVRICCTVETR
jgi:hypothetical protein